MTTSKKVRIFCGGLTNTIWAVRRYSEKPGGVIVAATNGKDDVTEEAISAVAEHRARCTSAECRCGWSTDDWFLFATGGNENTLGARRAAG